MASALAHQTKRKAKELTNQRLERGKLNGVTRGEREKKKSVKKKNKYNEKKKKVSEQKGAADVLNNVIHAGI